MNQYKLTLIFCEGIHDIHFLIRLLKDNGFRDKSGTPIENFGNIDFQNLLLGQMEKYKPSADKSIKYFVHTPFLLKKDDIFILIYSTGGHIYKNKDRPEKDIFKNTSNDFKLLFDSGILKRFVREVKLGLIYDADDDIAARLKEIKDYLEETATTRYEQLEHNEIIDSPPFKGMGCYLFRALDSDESGNLETILLPILKDYNRNVYDNTVAYIEENKVDSEKDFKEEKAIIGIIGQLIKSGSANSVIISQTPFFKDRLTNKRCKEVIDFINKLIEY